MSDSEVPEDLHEMTSLEGRGKWIAIYIAFLAVLLAIGSMLGANAAKDAFQANVDASNLWAWFQAKNVRQTDYELAADGLRIMLSDAELLNPETRDMIREKLDEYEQKISEYQTEPETEEGLTELAGRAQACEAIRDRAYEKDPYFDYGEAFLQIAIVLASAAIVSKLPVFLWGSISFGAAGTGFMINGQFLLVHFL